MVHPDKLKVLIAYVSQYIEVSAEELSFLEKKVLERTFRKKEIIHKQGDEQKYIGFVIKGAMRFYYVDASQRAQTFEFAFEEAIVGNYQDVIAGVDAPAYAEAIEETVLMGIFREDLVFFLQKFPRYYALISEIMGQALSKLSARDKILRIPSSRERYQELVKISPQVVQRVPLTYIASYLKMALGTLSRVRAGKL